MIIKLNDTTPPLANDILTVIFKYILKMFKNLYYLNFEPSSIYYQQASFNVVSLKNIFSSNLLTLYINVANFTDCLYVPDGHFNKLGQFYIKISNIRLDETNEINKEKLITLKCFSLTCDVNINAYDELIIPLIHRMPNLEIFFLYLMVIHKETFIDGNELKYNILNYLLYLKIFSFNIHSFMSIDNEIQLLSNEDIQRTLTNIGNNEIISCVNYYPESKLGHCNIYSYSCPNRMKCFYYITNNFPRGLFKHVRKISLFDEYPFEHEFFIQISQAFPFVASLSLTNKTPQNKTCQPGNLLIIQYAYLIELNFDDAHDDYVEEFLMDKKTSLPDNVLIWIGHSQLKRVTNNFTRQATKINCKKMGYKY